MEHSTLPGLLARPRASIGARVLNITYRSLVTSDSDRHVEGRSQELRAPSRAQEAMSLRPDFRFDPETSSKKFSPLGDRVVRRGDDNDRTNGAIVIAAWTAGRQRNEEQAAFVEKGGWALMPGGKRVGEGVPRACAALLSSLK